MKNWLVFKCLFLLLFVQIRSRQSLQKPCLAPIREEVEQAFCDKNSRDFAPFEGILHNLGLALVVGEEDDVRLYGL